MKLEEQVCSLELSKRLKELGIDQDSLFYYIEKTTGQEDETEIKIKYKNYSDESGVIDKCSAFTLSELFNLMQDLMWNSWLKNSESPRLSFWFSIPDKMVIMNGSFINTISMIIINIIENGITSGWKIAIPTSHSR